MRSAKHQKWRRSGLIALLIFLSFSGIFNSLYDLTPLPAWETETADYLTDVRERATYAYAAARSLNAVISLLASIDVGIGLVSAEPAQALAPLDDMIEQFSDLILLALVSIGFQEILIAILSDISWSYLLPIALCPALLAPWLGTWQPRLERLSGLLILFVIATRLIIPSIALGGALITDTYLRNDYQMAVDEIKKVSTETSQTLSKTPKAGHELPPKISTPSSSVFSNPDDQGLENILIPDWDMISDIATGYDDLFALLNDIPARIITLITIFAFETLALPLVMIFLFIGLGRSIFMFISPKP